MKEPVKLRIKSSITLVSDVLFERLAANYSLMSAHVAPKDLLFLSVAPLEFPELSGNTSLLFQENRQEVNNMTLDVVNNLVNRVLLESSPSFTYQDQVYITRALHKLGITDVSLFMQEARSMRKENLSVYSLLQLYRDHQQTILKLAGDSAGGPSFTQEERVYILDTLRKLQVTDVSSFLKEGNFLLENKTELQRLVELYQENPALFASVAQGQQDGPVFTLEDRAYIENTLRELQVTDISTFLKERNFFREDHAVPQRLVQLYQENPELFVTTAQREDGPSFSPEDRTLIQNTLRELQVTDVSAFLRENSFLRENFTDLQRLSQLYRENPGLFVSVAQGHEDIISFTPEDRDYIQSTLREYQVTDVDTFLQEKNYFKENYTEPPRLVQLYQQNPSLFVSAAQGREAAAFTPEERNYIQSALRKFQVTNVDSFLKERNYFGEKYAEITRLVQLYQENPGRFVSVAQGREETATFTRQDRDYIREILREYQVTNVDSFLKERNYFSKNITEPQRLVQLYQENPSLFVSVAQGREETATFTRQDRDYIRETLQEYQVTNVDSFLKERNYFRENHTEPQRLVQLYQENPSLFVSVAQGGQDTVSFTREDWRFLENILRELKVTDFSSFLQESKFLQENNSDLQQLIELHQKNPSLFVSLAKSGTGDFHHAEHHEKFPRQVLPAPRYYLHTEIYHRLKTAQIYEQFQAFHRDQTVSESVLFRSELRLAEQLRVSRELSLWELKNQLFFREQEQFFSGEAVVFNTENAVGQPKTEEAQHHEEGGAEYRQEQKFSTEMQMVNRYDSRVEHNNGATWQHQTFFHHENHYETGGILPQPQTENQVLFQGAAAVLLSLTDSAVTACMKHLSSRRDFWWNLRSAIPGAAENSVWRFKFYHTEPLLTKAGDEYTHRLTALYQQELGVLQNFISSNAALEQNIWAQSASEYQEENLSLTYMALDAEENPAAPQGKEPQSQAFQDRDRELVQLTRQMLQKEKTTSESLREEKEHSQILRERHSTSAKNTITVLQERFRESLRELNSAEIRVSLAQQQPVSPEFKQVITEKLETLLQDSQTFAAVNSLDFRTFQSEQSWDHTESLLQDSRLIFSSKEGELPLEEERAPAAEIILSETKESELLREVERIDRRNREIHDRVQAEKAGRIQKTAAAPDKQRMFLDALQALEMPPELVREKLAAPTELHHREDSLVPPEILEHTDQVTRNIYESVLRYQRDPAGALASGVIRPAGAAEFDAELLRIREQEKLELTQFATLRQEASGFQSPVREALASLQETPPYAASPSVAKAATLPPSVPIVYRRTENSLSDEVLERLQKQSSVEEHRETVTNTVSTSNVELKGAEAFGGQSTVKTAQDITELVNRTLARQLGNLSDRVYSKMEKRLQNERARRGF